MNTEELNTIKNNLKAIQEFDTSKLARTDALGTDHNFLMAVDPAKKLLRLYNQIPLISLENLPNTQLTHINSQCVQDLKTMNEILAYKITDQNSIQKRDALINRINSAFQNTFNVLKDIISYALITSLDTNKWEDAAKKAINIIKTKTDSIDNIVKKTEAEIEASLIDVKKLSAESGVSQRAIHFKKEVEQQNKSAVCWLCASILLFILLSLYLVLSLFITKISFFSDIPQIQIAISKILTFGVLSYFLYFAVKNFMSHKHNAIINKHRQNSLMTYKVLVNASKDNDKGDIILSQAASCIFSPQPTGFSKDLGHPSSNGIIEFLARISGKDA
ncbi:hypothetical protein HOC37_02255 [bacterium]|jgi:hypothetical protein|nr:hypothetical protein [bacterium]MBT3580707.1 hypothetical protein [bacterium]MBT4551791.1 hypothetical protein [bacterium]MBT5988690.1 hypothetical protein [bacterium]MBT7087950.1 hypothetical protein [bacterium]